MSKETVIYENDPLLEQYGAYDIDLPLGVLTEEYGVTPENEIDDSVIHVFEVYKFFLEQLEKAKERHPDLYFANAKFERYGERGFPSHLVIYNPILYKGTVVGSTKLGFRPVDLNSYKEKYFDMTVVPISFGVGTWRDNFMPEYSNSEDREQFLKDLMGVQAGMLTKIFNKAIAQDKQLIQQNKDYGGDAQKKAAYEEALESIDLFEKTISDLSENPEVALADQLGCGIVDIYFRSSDFLEGNARLAEAQEFFSENLNQFIALCEANVALFKSYKNDGYTQTAVFQID